ncbi:MAG: hypothetical protein DMF87_25940 [Acidobacteria bacterium]|nr:MAG: hypothetical protein DMF87_25940 [Acidobacteriota bacterium]
MYDREVDVPRLMGHYRLDPPTASAPAAILADSVAPHNDHWTRSAKAFRSRCSRSARRGE